MTDDGIAARLRSVEAKLRELGLIDLADDLAELVAVLADPEATS